MFLIIAGLCFGWLLPEFFLILSKQKVYVPVSVNIISAIAGGSFAAAYVL